MGQITRKITGTNIVFYEAVLNSNLEPLTSIEVPYRLDSSVLRTPPSHV